MSLFRAAGCFKAYFFALKSGMSLKIGKHYYTASTLFMWGPKVSEFHLGTQCRNVFNEIIFFHEYAAC